MNIFLSYGYQERDEWVPRLVGPLIRAFGATVVTGTQLGGQRITEGVTDLVASCDALIAFATRRGEPGADGSFGTHRWVTDELAQALALSRNPGMPPIRVLEVREKGVADQGGVAGDRQRVEFDVDELAPLLVDIAQVVGDWARGLTMRFRIRPEGVVKELRPALSRAGFRCTYELNQDGRIVKDQPATIIKRSGGLEVTARGLPPKSLVRVRVEADGKVFGSEFNPLDALNVTLEPES